MKERLKERIRYSVSWEDPQLIQGALKIDERDTLVIITSGGCNVFNLLLHSPKEVISIDRNASQNYLMELKMRAVRELEYNEFFSFLGFRESKERVKTYQAMRGGLSSEARMYWDARIYDIARGICHSGKFEKYVGIFRNRILPLIHSRKDLEKLFSFPSSALQKEYYDTRWDSRRWRWFFKFFFHRRLLQSFGRDSSLFTYSEEKNLGNYYLRKISEFFRAHELSGNYFLHYLFFGKYSSPFYPPYLEEKNFYFLKSRVHTVKLLTQDAGSFILGMSSKRVYKLSLSDIFESGTQEETEEFFAELSHRCALGTKICFWNNLVLRHPQYSQNFIRSKELEDELKKREKIFFYSNFYVYERK